LQPSLKFEGAMVGDLALNVICDQAAADARQDEDKGNSEAV
jgi:hypothetical protein